MIELTADNDLNYKKLERGDFISHDVLRIITGKDPYENYNLYALAVLAIRSKLRKDFKMFTRGEGNSLRILTSNEATYYKAHRGGVHRRAQERDYGDLASIDERDLDEITRKQHRRHIDEASRFLSAQQQASKQIRSEAIRERISRVHQEQPLTYISTKGIQTNGTTDDEGKNQRDVGSLAS